MTENTAVYGFEGFRLDVNRQRLFREDDVVSLPPKAIDLLVLLVENQGSILDKEVIIDELWSDTIVEDANLTQTIYLLRKALGKTSGGGSFINTIPKRGYKFIPSVESFPDQEISVSVTKRTTESIFISREHSETTEASISGGLTNSHVPTAELPDNQGHKEGSDGFRSSYLLAIIPIALIGLLGFAYLWNSYSAKRSLPNDSIAVVPFKIIGAEDKEGYLSEGLADTLTTRLGQTKKINVFSTEKVRRYSRVGVAPLEIGKKLGADSVLTGNLQRIENRVRFNAQLLRVSDGQILWSNQFDEQSEDFFKLQDSLTGRIIKALTLEFSEGEQKQLANNPTDNPEALKMYWQGRYYWGKRTPKWVQKGIESFEKAIELDPKFAKAYAGLADSYVLASSGLPPDVRLPKAVEASKKALELDDNLAEAHASLAIVVYKLTRNWDEAEGHFKKAISLDNSYATAHHWYGEFLVLMGRHDEGINELKRAEEFDPFSIAIKTDISEALYRAERFDKAIEQAKRVLEYDPKHVQAYRILRHIYNQQMILLMDLIQKINKV